MRVRLPLTRLPFTLVCLSLLTQGALAAPPVNDSWADRILISSSQLSTGFSNSQDLAEATTETTDPSVICKIGNPLDRGNTAW